MVSIKIATKNDIDLITKLRYEFAIELGGSMNVDQASNYYSITKKYFEEELNQTFFMYLLYVNEIPLSTAGFVVRKQMNTIKNPSGIWAYVMSIYTLPEFRKKGYSKQLMMHLIDEVKKMNITAIELHATKMGEPIYQQISFELHPEPTYRMYL